jgi:hypothetical protein
MVQKIKIGDEILDYHGNVNLIKKYFSKGESINFWFCDENRANIHSGVIIGWGGVNNGYNIKLSSNCGREGDFDINMESKNCVSLSC